MKKASTLSHKTLKRPSNVFTVGENNCDFTDLVTALQNGSENDTFIVYGGVHDGKFLFRQGQSFHLIGDVTFKQSQNDNLFVFIPSSSYAVDSANEISELVQFHCTFSGSIPELIPYGVKFFSSDPFSDNEGFPKFNGFCDLRNLFIFRKFRITQNGTSAPVIHHNNDINNAPLRAFTNIPNLVANLNYTEYYSPGEFDVQLMPEMYFPFDKVAHLSITNHLSTNIITSEHVAEEFVLNLTVKDHSGNKVNGMDAQVLYTLPFNLIFE